MVPVFKNVGKGQQLKTTAPLVFFTVVSKVFEKLLISSMVLSLFDQLQIFLQLDLIELLGLLTGLGLLELWHLAFDMLVKRLGMLVFFTNVNLMEFQVRYLASFLLF